MFEFDDIEALDLLDEKCPEKFGAPRHFRIQVPGEALEFLEQAVEESALWSQQVLESFASFDLMFRGVDRAKAGQFTVVNASVFKETKGNISQSDFQVRLPVGADVLTLRSVMIPDMVGYPKVLGEARPGMGVVPLWDTELVPSHVVISDFPGRPNRFYARFSIWECYEAHRMVRDFFLRPENQRKVESVCAEASGDETRYQMLIVSLLTREVYPAILQRFGLPQDLQPFQTLVNCFVTSFMDYEVAQVWFEAELLMRNRRKCSQAYAYLSYHCMKLGLPPPSTAACAEAVAGTLSRAWAGAMAAGQPSGGLLPSDGNDHLRLVLRPHKLVSVEIPWAWRLAKRMPFVVGVVENVFTEREADELRALVDARGYYKQATGKARTGLIAELHLHGLAKDLWSRMLDVVSLDHGDKRAMGLSEHLRFLKYGPGDFFAPHEDGAQNHTNEDGVWLRSVYSALLYLSDPEEGSVPGAGGTRFISPECPSCNASGRCEEFCEFCVDAPVRKGGVLLFAQSLLHAGTMPRIREKFVMRTDVMFSV